MPNYHAWLDEVRPSPYADQLTLGFRWLRFSRVLEREYRAHMLEDSFELRRIALIVATVIWLALAALDVLVVPASHLGWVIATRVVVLVILLVGGVFCAMAWHCLRVSEAADRPGEMR